MSRAKADLSPSGDSQGLVCLSWLLPFSESLMFPIFTSRQFADSCPKTSAKQEAECSCCLGGAEGCGLGRCVKRSGPKGFPRTDSRAGGARDTCQCDRSEHRRTFVCSLPSVLKRCGASTPIRDVALPPCHPPSEMGNPFLQACKQKPFEFISSVEKRAVSRGCSWPFPTAAPHAPPLPACRQRAGTPGPAHARAASDSRRRWDFSNAQEPVNPSQE